MQRQLEEPGQLHQQIPGTGETLDEKSMEIHTNMPVTRQALQCPQLAAEVGKLKRQFAANKGGHASKKRKLQAIRVTAAAAELEDIERRRDDDGSADDGRWRCGRRRGHGHTQHTHTHTGTRPRIFCN